MLSFFPLDVLDEILDVIESVSEGFLTYSCRTCTLEIVWDFISFSRFDIIICSELDNHASVKQVMSM